MKKRGTTSKRVTRTRRRSNATPATLLDAKAVDRAVARGARDAVLRHKRLGQTIYALKDGRVVEIPASKIRVPRAP